MRPPIPVGLMCGARSGTLLVKPLNTLVKPEDIVEVLILEMGRSSSDENRELPMNLPLGEIIGSYDPAVLEERVRMVVAYDN